MSSMRSASSSTSISTRDRSTQRCPCRSIRRPGVATRMSTPRLSCEACGPRPTPPKTAVDVIHQCLLTHGHYGWSLDLPHQLVRERRDVVLAVAQRRLTALAGLALYSFLALATIFFKRIEPTFAKIL